MKTKIARALLALIALALSAAALPAAVEVRQRFDEAMAAFHLSLTNSTNGAIRNAAQYLERILARKDELQAQAIDEVALRRRLFLDYFLVKDEAHYTAQLQALARLQQQSAAATPTPLFTPIAMREDGEEITGAIDVEFDIRTDGRVAHRLTRVRRRTQ